MIDYQAMVKSYPQIEELLKEYATKYPLQTTAAVRFFLIFTCIAYKAHLISEGNLFAESFIATEKARQDYLNHIESIFYLGYLWGKTGKELEQRFDKIIAKESKGDR